MNRHFKQNSERKPLTIGIPVFNEEQTLPVFFEHFTQAVDEMPRSVDVEALFCVNGCTDKSLDVIEALCQTRPDLNLGIVLSDKGKINAQVSALQNRKNDGYIAFMDSDVLPSRNTLKALYNKLDTDPQCYVAYAAVEPYYPPDSENSHFSDILATGYRYRSKQEPRKFFHGRAFMLPDARYFEGINADIPERLNNIKDPRQVAFLGLEKGALVDDIYLSRVVAHEHGLKSICEVPEAIVQFQPPKTLKDYRKIQHRTLTEIERLNILFPEHVYLQREHFEQDPKAQFERASAAMSPQDRKLYELLMEINAEVKESFRDKLKLQREGTPVNALAADGWETASTTKEKIFIGRVGQPDTKAANEENFHAEPQPKQA